MKSLWAFWQDRLWPYWRDYPWKMKDVWWDLALGVFLLWMAYDYLTYAHRQHRIYYDGFHLWFGVFFAIATAVFITRGMLVWRKLKKQKANSPSATS